MSVPPPPSSSVVARALSELQASLHTTKQNEELSKKKKLLTIFQENHIRNPSLIVRYGVNLLQHTSRVLGSAIWDMYERVFLSSLDIGDMLVSTWCINKLLNKWGDMQSVRTDKLLGMKYEAMKQYPKAVKIYKRILKSDSTNIGALRRLICIAYAQQQHTHTITLINEYLRLYPIDESAWCLLQQCYLNKFQYDYAKYCCEELISLAPENYNYHILYGDILTCLGQYDLARLSYLQSIELKPSHNLRAYYGLLSLYKFKNCGGSQEAYDWCMTTAENHYSKYAPNLLKLFQQTWSEPTDSKTSASASASISKQESKAESLKSDTVSTSASTQSETTTTQHVSPADQVD